MYQKQYAEAKRAGPRDVFGHEPIRTPVIAALARLGLGGELVIDLLGVDDAAVEETVRAALPDPSGEPDLRASLRAWAERHAFEERHMSKSYASACGASLDTFRAGRFGSPERNAWAVTCRVNRELRQALCLWLGVGRGSRMPPRRASCRSTRC